jgi:hypothetical protein
VVFAALVQRPQSDIAIHTLGSQQASLATLVLRAAGGAPVWRICVFLLSADGAHGASKRGGLYRALQGAGNLGAGGARAKS